MYGSRCPSTPVPELDQSAVLATRPGGGWPTFLPVLELLGMLAAAVSLLLPPHTHEAKANELLLFYGFGGLWVSARVLRGRPSRRRWLLFAVIALALLVPRLLGLAPVDVGPSTDPPWLAYPFSVRLIELAVAVGVGLAGVLGTRLALAVADRAHWSLGASQLGRRSVFLCVASCIVLAASLAPLRPVTAAALLPLICYSFAWSVAPTILRLAQTRPLPIAGVTIASAAAVTVVIVQLLRGLEAHGPLSDLSAPWATIAFLTIVGLLPFAVTGAAALISELAIRVTSRFGNLTTRFFVFGCVVAVLVGDKLIWPIEFHLSAVRGQSQFDVSLDLAVIAILAAALGRRLARDLATARSRFQAIASGGLLEFVAMPGREESGRLLQRISHFSTQLGKRPFLEKLNAETRARGDQLQAATGRLTETNNQRLHAERFSAIAGIVATVGHELRNPVAQIAGNLPLIASYVEVTVRCARGTPAGAISAPGLLARTAQRLSASGRDVEESARRAELILGDLNAVSATPLRALEEVDLRAVIERSVRLTPCAPDVRLQCVLESVPKLTARAGELEQVIVNLIENAMDAVTPAGRIFVRLRRAGVTVSLEVEDDGPGMTEEVLNRATEPFFTTKPAGKGTGLGLAIAASIVRAHHGTLELKSQKGAGTRVDVRFPLPEQLRVSTTGSGAKPS
jgi:signal transduction histidine kinase